MPSVRFELLLAASLTALPACNLVVWAEDTEGSTSLEEGSTSGDVPTSGGGATGDCDFESSIQPIFTASCGCHGGGAPSAGLSLAEGAAYAGLVGVASSQEPGTLRVAAGDPGASWLVAKLEGTASVGGQMPVDGALGAAQIDVIKEWIAAGAPETETFACGGGGGGGDVGDVEIDVAGKIEVQVGEIVEVDAVVTTPEGEPLPAAAVTWSSSAERALYVDGTGALLGVSVGTAELRAHSGGVESAPIVVEVVAHDPAPATFSQVLEITEAKCAVSGCHVDGVEPGDLRFDRDRADIWEALLEDGAEQVEGLARVLANVPEDSWLVRKIVERAPAVGAQMPIGGAPMPAAEVRTIVRWILAGALND